MIDPVVNLGSAGHVLSLVRSGVANTRPALAKQTALSRTAVSLRIDMLTEAGLVVEDGSAKSTGGRRATYLRFAHDSGVVMVADLGVSVARLAITDLGGNVLASAVEEESMKIGPGAYLEWMSERLAALLVQSGRKDADLRGIGIGLPGPVEHATGRSIAPPSMPGWDNYPAAEYLQERFATPVVVDNDVNIMAWGEYTRGWRHEASNFLLIKVADAGIGCGIVSAGRIHHGAQGSAGAIGHIAVPGYQDWECRCGNAGCLGAAVGGEALARRLGEAGQEVTGGREVAELSLAGNLAAVQEIRGCGRALGEVVAGIVNFFNPDVIVVGGVVAAANEQLIAGLREVIYQKCLPLALRDLRLAPATLGEDAGILGAASMTIDRVMAPNAVDELLRSSGIKEVSGL